MTNTTSNNPPESPAQGPRSKPQGYYRRVLGDTVCFWGARFGLCWITLLMIAAIFAPFIANSHPLLMKMQGHWSSPALRHLMPTDVVLLIGFVIMLVLLPINSLSFVRRVAIWLFYLTVMLPLTTWPTLVDNWQYYQELTGKGLFFILLVIVCAADLGALILLACYTSLSLSQRIKILIGALLLGLLLTIFQVRPPDTVVYEQYREAAAQNKIQVAIYAPIRFSPTDRQRDEPELRLKPPTASHLMGTDINGSDIASRMIHASRIALSLGFISTGIATIIGVIVGGILGYFSGWVDLVGLRIVEVFSAIPTLFLLLAFVAFFGRNLYLMMAIIGLTGWVGDAIFVRAEFLRLRQQDFVNAAHACGLPLYSILFKHMLPNAITPVLINITFGVAGAILTESTISFLGLGLVDEPSWGQVLNEALGAGGTFYWWIALYPGLAIFLTIFSYNLVGESLRDAIDPRSESATA